MKDGAKHKTDIGNGKYGTTLLRVAELSGMVCSAHTGMDQLMDRLSEYLDLLVDTDFNRIVSLLYRIDVDEAKVRAALAEDYGRETPGRTFTRLFIERISEKEKWRARYSRVSHPDGDSD